MYGGLATEHQYKNGEGEKDSKQYVFHLGHLAKIACQGASWHLSDVAIATNKIWDTFSRTDSATLTTSLCVTGRDFASVSTFVTSDTILTFAPFEAAQAASTTVDIPTTSAPIRRNIRISALVSYDGP